MIKWLCKKLGHTKFKETRRWFVTPRYRSIHVADEIVEERFRCRCGEANSDWQEVDRSGINSLTMSPECWAFLRRDGKISA